MRAELPADQRWKHTHRLPLNMSLVPPPSAASSCWREAFKAAALWRHAQEESLGCCLLGGGACAEEGSGDAEE